MNNLNPLQNIKLVDHIKHFLMQPKLFVLFSQLPAGQSRDPAARAPASCGTSLKSSNIAQSLTYVTGIKEKKITTA